MYRTLSRSTLLAVFATSILTTATPCVAWAKRVTPPASFVSADIPEPIVSESGTRDTIAGDVTRHTLSGGVGDAKLSITASVLPGFVTAVTTDGTLLRRARRELLKNYGAAQKSWTKCEFKGAACRRLGYRTTDGRTGKALLVLEGNVLVVLNAVYNEDADAAQKFLRSAT